jgi:hypothetical protein
MIIRLSSLTPPREYTAMKEHFYVYTVFCKNNSNDFITPYMIQSHNIYETFMLCPRELSVYYSTSLYISLLLYQSQYMLRTQFKNTFIAYTKCKRKSTKAKGEETSASVST